MDFVECPLLILAIKIVYGTICTFTINEYFIHKISKFVIPRKY